MNFGIEPAAPFTLERTRQCGVKGCDQTAMAYRNNCASHVGMDTEIVVPKRRNLAPILSSDRQDWGTPQDLYDKLNVVFKFTLDPCTGPDNRLGTQHFFTEKDDGLAWPWYGDVFMNPPYGRVIGDWITKAWEESVEHEATVVCLVPSRTGPAWFQVCFAHARAICFLPGRLKFVLPDRSSTVAPFDSAIVVFSPHQALPLAQASLLRSLGPTWEHFA